jgi:hypothetical protein
VIGSNYPPKSKLDYDVLFWNVIRGNVDDHPEHFTGACCSLLLGRHVYE